MPDAELKTYACPECGFHYRDEQTMKACEAWCKEHGSCSTEITALSVERTERTGSDPRGSDPKVPELAEKCAEMEAARKRALADYQNLQKEVARERSEMGAYAVLRVTERFLPALDYFKTALAHKPDPDKLDAWFVGIGHIQKQFDEALADLGIRKIAAVGEKFDAAKHEAVGEEAAEDREPGTVIREVRSGYEMGGKVVRPVKIILAK